MSKETFTTAEAAEVLGVSATRVRQMVLDGTLPAEKFGRDLVITSAALELARKRKTKPGPVPKVAQPEAKPKRGRKGGEK